VADVKDETVTIELEGGVRLKIEKTAVSMDFSQKNQKN
jgi:preprotein translocase subunit YajC